jgi:hypothetical protein
MYYYYHIDILEPDALARLVREAYGRFKSMVYHDANDLELRAALAQFEHDGIDQKLDTLTRTLQGYLGGQYRLGKFDPWLSKITSRYHPKRVKGYDHHQKRSPRFLSNVGEESIEVEKFTRYFSGPIEIHLISTLWIMTEGYRLVHPSNRYSYGNQLDITAEGQFRHAKNLFVPYFNKYQEWRNRGIKSAREQLDFGNNVLLASLDVRSFYESVRINPEMLYADLGIIKGTRSITDIVIRILRQYPRLEGANDGRHCLPIGLACSGVLANWHMKHFDEQLVEAVRPVYYGRYVDDIFLVLSNVTPPRKVHDWPGSHEVIETSQREQGDESTADPTEWFMEKFFPDNVGPLILKNVGDDAQIVFKDPRYFGLALQPEKVKLFHFDASWPLASLKNFEQQLKENSSVFWLLPEEGDGRDSLDESAYDLQYTDSEFSFRSLDDVRFSKFGASAYLAKKIRLAVASEDSAEKELWAGVKRIFRGGGLVLGSNLWEKVLTYFTLVNDQKGYRDAVNLITRGIQQLESQQESVSGEDARSMLQHRLAIAMAMSSALRPAILDSIRRPGSTHPALDEVEAMIPSLRSSMLIRHHHLKLPILAITGYSRTTTEPLVHSDFLTKIVTQDLSVAANLLTNGKSHLLPRWIYLQECCMLEFSRSFANVSAGEAPFDFKPGSIEYFEGAKGLFEQLNKVKLGDELITEPLTQIEPNMGRVQAIRVDLNTTDPAKVIRVGLTNMKVDEKQVAEEIRSWVRLERTVIDRHFRILNDAERDRADILLLPECAVPWDLLPFYLDRSRRQERAMVLGMKHITVGDICFNFSMTVLPLKVRGSLDAILIPRLKNHYGLHECKVIKSFGKAIPSVMPYRYHWIRWRDVYFSVYNCYELADVKHRGLFRSKVEVLFAIELNRDTPYFSNIAETVSRDVHCYFVQANTSHYGDTRIVQPTSSVEKDLVRVQGGVNDVVLIGELDIHRIRRYQQTEVLSQTDEFKRTPPDYDHNEARKR